MEPSTRTDTRRDYSRWNAEQWATVVPDIPADAALAAVRYMAVANLLAESQLQSLRPWKAEGITSVDDFRTLALVRHASSSGIRIADIADALRALPGTISNRIDRLTSHGWIERTVDGADRRSSLLRITPERSEQIDQMYRALVAQHRDFFSPLLEAEVAAMTMALGKLLPEIDNPYRADERSVGLD